MAQCDLLIIGSGPAAWSCALTARQRNLSVIVAATESSTGWLQKAERIDNYPGMPQVSGKELLRVFRQQAADAGVTVLPCLARQVMHMGQSCATLVGDDIVESKAVVLATGASRPRLLPGEEALIGQGVSWCGTCDAMFFKGQDVAVISAWTGGVEEALFIANIAKHVDYYTLTPHEQPDEVPYEKCIGKPKELRRSDEEHIEVVTDQGCRKYSGVFVFRPSFAAESLVPGLSMNGPFISVDRQMRTNLPGVYACGDCTGHPLQIAKAVGEGNIAAISAAEDIAKLTK